MTFVLFVLLAIAVFAAVVAASLLLIIVRDRAPFIPTDRWVIDWFVENVHPEDGTTLLDIGCGDARLLCAMKRSHPSIRAVGYERSWVPYLLARWRAHGLGVELHHRRYERADFGSAGIIYCYLLDSIMPGLERLLGERCEPGTAIYSYAFTFPSWTPERTITHPTRVSTLRLYRVPDRQRDH